MTVRLQPFKEKKQCKKCGCKDVHRAFVPAAAHSKFSSDACNIQKEHHDLYCRGCSYTWAERIKP